MFCVSSCLCYWEYLLLLLCYCDFCYPYGYTIVIICCCCHVIVSAVTNNCRILRLCFSHSSWQLPQQYPLLKGDSLCFALEGLQTQARHTNDSFIFSAKFDLAFELWCCLVSPLSQQSLACKGLALCDCCFDATCHKETVLTWDYIKSSCTAVSVYSKPHDDKTLPTSAWWWWFLCMCLPIYSKPHDLKYSDRGPEVLVMGNFKSLLCKPLPLSFFQCCNLKQGYREQHV